MAKLIILSIVLFMVILPIAQAEKSAPKRTLRRIQVLTFIATVVWTYACRAWYPQLVVID